MMNDDAEVSDAVDELQQQWISCHLYYHEDLNRVVRGFVQPAIRALLDSAWIDAFFFVRYSLGGPHVRLRLRPLPGCRDDVLAAVESFAKEFLGRTPSTKSLDEEVVRRTTDSILSFDPNETDHSIYPDNSLAFRPFRPEVERYGGPQRLQASLDFFVLSSVTAVQFLMQHGEAPRSVQLEQALRLLLQQAAGFAADGKELLDLLRYGMDSWSGGGPPKVLEKADKVFALQTDAFLQLFRTSLRDVRSLLEGGERASQAVEFLVLGAARLSAAVHSEDRATRARIGGSQLHMTATRLGIGNAEEVYISRLLTSTLRELSATGEEDLSWLGEQAAKAATEKQGEPLSDLLLPALAAFAAASDPLP
jgi:Lantibiotic biosynthesis dehydratase C-term